MTDYNKYLVGLMADCRRSVQCPSYQPQYPHLFPQHVATPPAPRLYSFKEPPTTAPQPCISGDLPATATAATVYTPRYSSSSAVTPRPSVSKDPPPAETAPHPDVNKNVPPAADAPPSAIPRNLLPAATTPSPFVPLFQLPIATSGSAYALQTSNEPETPIRHVEAKEDPRKDYTKEEQGKGFYARYKNMPQSAMREELKSRGLLCHGRNVDLVKRLEQDDSFQTKPRTAENYDTMDSSDIFDLCVRRFIPSQGTLPLLRARLKGHDKRVNRKKAAVPRPSLVTVPSEPPSALDTLEEKPVVPTVKDKETSRTERAGSVKETAEIAAARRCVESKPTNRVLSAQCIRRSCNHCRIRKRQCVHDTNGKVEYVRAIEPAAPIPATYKGYTKNRAQPIAYKPTLDIQEVAPTSVKRLRLSQPKASAPQNDERPGLAIVDFAGTRVTRSRMSNPKASASQHESPEPMPTVNVRTPTGSPRERVKTKENVSKSRRTPLHYQPRDEIALLRICVKLKTVVAWGKISGFWNMVQDTLQLETGKPYKKVSRHVSILVDKRRAEQHEIEQGGKISISRVSAGCRPLLDKWIAGGNGVNHDSPNSSATPILTEDEDDMSLGEEVEQQLDSDRSAEVQKRSATDAWLDTSYDTTRCKKLKLRTSEVISSTSKFCDDSVGCWSLSGSSVTSESSIEDENEDEDDDDVKIRD